MFFLRCAFWLTIVYASMSWAPGAFAPAGVGASLVAAGRTQAEALVKSAAAGATDLCARHASECLADAARLTSLVDATERAAAADAGEPDPIDTVKATDAATASIPLPIPDPRRKARDAKLARAP